MVLLCNLFDKLDGWLVIMVFESFSPESFGHWVSFQIEDWKLWNSLHSCYFPSRGDSATVMTMRTSSLPNLETVS